MFAALALLAISLQAAPEPPAPETLELGRAADGRLSIDVTIEGRGPWPFILDTGASHTAIAQPVAVEFGFEPTGVLYDVQTLTEEIRAERLVLADVRASGLTAPHLDVVVVETSTDLDLNLFGLLGNDMFEGRTTAIDVANAELILDAPAPAHEDARLYPDRNVPVGEAVLRRARGPVHALIDTGSARTIINSRLARRLRQNGPRLRFDIMGASRLARRETDADAVRIDRFRIGGVCGAGLVAVRADVDVFRDMGWAGEPAMIIGMDALADAVITIDHDTGVVEISPAQGGRCRR
ncbi:MAG: retroviral-like aspartic protease family protein [Oceanicaulis sp.]